VDGQQHVLDDVVDGILGPAAPPGERANERDDRLQEQAVGAGVAALAGGEKLAPAFVARDAAIADPPFLSAPV
jgi:hypothetical protein